MPQDVGWPARYGKAVSHAPLLTALTLKSHILIILAISCRLSHPLSIRSHKHITQYFSYRRVVFWPQIATGPKKHSCSHVILMPSADAPACAVCLPAHNRPQTWLTLAL